MVLSRAGREVGQQSFWWRRRESNPGPKRDRRSLYEPSTCLTFAAAGPTRRACRSYPLRISPTASGAQAAGQPICLTPVSGPIGKAART
jgi:hypothetical protein